MQRIESVISDTHRETFKIVDFIFHIIEAGEENKTNVIYLDEVELAANQKKFFIKILKDISEGTQYVFVENAVNLKNKCEEMISNAEEFNQISREITADFAGRHKGQMSNGVFIVAKISYLKETQNPQFLIFLVKMDRQTSFTYSYRTENGKNIAKVDELKNALNENKAAVQKSALIDVSEQFVWDVLAFDRVKKPELGEYFKGFLGVTERQNDSHLTKAVHDTTRRWARGLSRGDMSPDEDANSIAGRSLEYLKAKVVFDTGEYIDYVIRDDNPERRAKLITALKTEMESKGVAGQSFSPKPDSLSRKQKRQTYQTAEGVVVMYEGTEEAAGIKLERDANGQIVKIVISTNRATIKS